MLALLFASLLAQPDLPIGSLGKTDFGNWTVAGDAFRKGPATGALIAKLEITNNLDRAVFSSEIEDDGPQGKLTSPAFKIERPYISFRVGGGDYETSTCLNLIVGGKVARSATGHRSDKLSPATWDVHQLQGKQARIEVVDKASGDWGHINVDHIVQTDQPEVPPFTAGLLYQEALRPQFHFTARQWTVSHPNPGMRQEGWVNDLNGLIYYDGEYHLFAQRWARCWLHAVSRDLVHWKELEPAFWEESEGSGVQSGSCVVDYQNTSGLAKDKAHPAMVAFWSRFDNRSQCISYSLDHGRSWTRYKDNPLFIHPERDPKVFWYAPGKHWVMMMYGDGAYHILNSPDLLHWTDQHHPIANSFECPDFFELPVDGDQAHKKWVLIQGNGNYSVGSFDGHEFKEEGGRNACDLGPNFYATQSWANTDTGDGRRIQTAWMRGSDFPEMPFNQQVSFPCELSMHSTSDGLRIFRKPIKEIEGLQGKPRVVKDFLLDSGRELPLASHGDGYRLVADVEILSGATLEVWLRGERVTFSSKEMTSGNAKGRVPGRIQRVEILLDRGSIEAFANDGELSSTRFVLPRDDGISIRAEGGAVRVNSLHLWPLKSAWAAK